MLSIKFGSGIVDTAVATDVVKVGAVTTEMNSSLLLMVGKELDFSGAFEGILGLGLPESDLGGSPTEANMTEIPGFLETAGVTRFSVCFNPGANGVLTLNQAPFDENLGAVGQSHWALNFAGYSFGNESSKAVSICNKKGQNDACVGIPDSGTTLIMAPSAHIIDLFASLCERWARCNQSLKAGSDKNASSDLFQTLLFDCSDYTSDTHGLDEELPDLHFHMSGDDGTKRNITLPGASYVYETIQDDIEYVHENLFGIFPIDIPVATGKKTRVCTPAFGALTMASTYDVPVWILGQPLFYQYQVGYDLSTDPPAVTFMQDQCGSCENGLVQSDPASLISQKRTSVRKPNLVLGPRRMPSIDLSRPP
jgi:hypothetical protein